MNLSDAMSQYLASLAVDRPLSTDRDLLRFGRWYGRERPIESLTPPEVARYAEEALVASGDVLSHLTTVKEFLGFLKRKGLSKHSLAPHVKVPKSAKPALPGSNNGDVNSIQMTGVGHSTLSQELRQLKGQRGDMAETIRLAAADRDFSENAPLDAAREAQGKMEARIRQLEETLRRAVIVDRSRSGSAGDVQVGSLVMLENLTSGKEVRYTLVDSAEADPLSGKLSVASPVGKALVGHYMGDEVEVSAPKGLLKYRIASVGE